MEKETVFDGWLDAPVEETPVVETPAEPVVATPEPEPAPVAEPVPDAKPEPGHVPITALLDEREKRKELERQLAAMRETQQPETLPDPVSDPLAYQQHLMQQVQQQVLDTRLNMSETAARRHYGNDVTQQAKDWALGKFGANPAFQAEVLGQPDPYGYAVEAYQRDQIASQVTADDFTQFQAWKAAQAQIAAAPVAATPQPTAAPPPRSIVSAPSAGGNISTQTLTDEEAFAAVIK